MSITLLFPPLVSSGFGSYYPALAVLSGSLTVAGHSVQQIDLNELFAEYLLENDRLKCFGRGKFYAGAQGSLEPSEMPAVAARILLKNRGMLFTSEQRHRFSEHDKTPAYLLQALSQPFVYDQVLSQTLDTLAGRGPLVDWYENFLDAQRLDERLETSANLIGISIPMGPQLLPALLLSRHLKELRPNVRILLGGPTMSLMQDDALTDILRRCSFIDAIVRYDGENPLRALADQARDGHWRPKDVPGVSSLNDDVPIHRPPSPGPALDKLPIADYDRTLLDRLSDPEFGVVQTRGCYWGRCAYCDFVELYEGSASYRGRSAQSFVDEVATHVERHGARRFSLITEAIPPSFSLRFSKLVIERGLEISWNSFAMVDRHFSTNHFEKMALSGCDHLVIGLETMTDRVLRRVHKYSTGDDNEAFLLQASDAGISLHINLIPNLPTTTFSEAMESLDRLSAIAHTLGGVAIFPFEATRSSGIGRDPEAYGLKVVESDSSEGQAVFADNHLSITDIGMTEGELHRVLNEYQAFADSVNALTGRRFASAFCSETTSATTELTIADRDFDMYVAENELLFFNWKTRERSKASRGLKAIIDQARSFKGTFTKQDLIANSAKQSEMAFLIDQIVQKGIFAPEASAGPFG